MTVIIKTLFSIIDKQVIILHKIRAIYKQNKHHTGPYRKCVVNASLKINILLYYNLFKYCDKNEKKIILYILLYIKVLYLICIFQLVQCQDLD